MMTLKSYVIFDGAVDKCFDLALLKGYQRFDAIVTSNPVVYSLGLVNLHLIHI